MTQPAIRVEGVTKWFKGYVQQTLVRSTLNALRGRRNPRERVNALNNVSFEVYPGQSVALMGLNGSGKTTALSLIARISSPSQGTITIRGRVGALLAVGTGLHTDMTGRENIEVYGRILGYTPSELRSRFDDIVDFAEVGYALDRPLKFWSSGMALRLGFSIAAHIQPEVMLVDEAVSVGDVLFQQRCLERMTELVKGGSALILVSHQPEIVARTCNEGLLLRQGNLVSTGPMDQIIGEYLEETGKVGYSSFEEVIELVEWDLSDVDYVGRRCRVVAKVRANERVDDPRFGVSIADLQHGPLITASMLLEHKPVGNFEGTYTLTCELKDIPLRAAVYRVVLYATSAKGGAHALAPHVLGHITWGEPTAAPVAVGKGAYGPVVVPTEWTLSSLGGAE
jgi:ABC-type polysaccharide/polyol phosphate transport system ATPase subunit